MSLLAEAVLSARGITSPERREEFLAPSYEANRHDPFLLPDMRQAVDRLKAAKEQGEQVTIYGDYDIDGLTASTILMEGFASFGIQARVYIPNRFVEGYGLSLDAVEKIAATGTTLIITVDCGSLSHTEVARANELGVDVIVTDHHTVAATKSSSTAMINPKWLLQEYPEAYDGFRLKPTSKKSLYPFVDLAGCGVAFKLIQALQTELSGLPDGQEKWLLDLVALGTVCDVVTLEDENRANVLWGLRVMKKTRRLGLQLLMAVSRVMPETLNARSLGFGLGPRLNASGRLETAQYALDLLMTKDRTEALRLATKLDLMNTERKAAQAKIVEEAKEQAMQFASHPVLVVSDPNWSHGIIGIVAAKLLETYHKPTFVLQELEDGTAKGSARSFGDFSAVEAIRATETHIIKGGGHKLAAGITLKTEHISAWRSAVNTFYHSLGLIDQARYLDVRSDVTLVNFERCTEADVVSLQKLEPYGHGNPEPVFQITPLTVVGRKTMGAGNQHVKYRLEDEHAAVMEFVAFSKADVFTAEVGEHVSVWCELAINEWQGRRSVEGRLLKMELAG